LNTWHSLADRSLAVSDLAAEFADRFGGGERAPFVGYLHDAGKASLNARFGLALP